MKYYAFIKDNKIDGKGNLPTVDMINCIEITQEVYADLDRYMYSNGEIVINPNYEEEQAQKERQRIGQLQVTKRVFALALQQLGISYSQLKDLIASNEQAQLEWDLCVELQRNNPLLDVMASQLGVSAEMLDVIFKRANGEAV